MDIKNAFLNGELDEKISMKIPLSFDNELQIGKVYKLKSHCMD